jgi:hypothetical protein
MGDLSIIDFYSLPVVLVEVLATTGVKLANATAFCIEHGGKHFLVTNWHNVAGREPFTGELKGPIRPERLRIHYRSYEDENLQGEDLREEELYDDSQPRWLEPKNQVVRRPAEGVNLRVDVALLEIRNPPTQLVSLPWTQNTFFHVKPGEVLQLIGFPLGKSNTGRLPIWLTGHVATDFAGQRGHQFFLVDARTREGMSGALVLHRTSGASFSKPGGWLGVDGSVSYVMGIYSGRLAIESDIGIVWHWEVIQEALEWTTSSPVSKVSSSDLPCVPAS